MSESTTPQSMAPSEKKKTSILTKPVIEWALWDWGSAAFNAVATTFVFSVYLTSDGTFTDKGTASDYLSWGLFAAGIIIALLAPITGQRADRRGKGGLALTVFTILVVICLALMFFVAPEGPLGPRGGLFLGIALLGIGNIFFEFASVNYNAMLNHLSTKENMGRISGLGWGSGYVGGIVLLLILYVGLISPEVGWFGITHANGLHIRVSMVIAAAWMLLSALPLMLHPVKPRHIDEHHGEHETLWDSYRKLWSTVKSLAKESPHTLFFLAASAVFRDGLAGVFTFGAILAGTAFGFSSGEVIIFAIAANVVAGIATIAMGALDDIIGPKRLIVISLSCMVIAGMSVFFLHNGGKIIFWTFGLALCVFVGPTQSASRSFLGRMIPEGREGEVFGLYATTGRAVSFLAPAMYGIFLAFGRNWTPVGADYTYWGILGIILILALGLVMTLFVHPAKARLDSLK